MLTLLWGLPEEAPIAAVGRELERRGHRWMMLDQRRVMETKLQADTNWSGGTLRVADCEIELRAVGSAYVRPHDTRRLLTPSVAEGSAPWQSAMELDQSLLTWLELTPARVVNRPAAMQPNSSKPFQLAVIRAFGFLVPRTLLTTDIGELQDFWEGCGEVVYKSASGMRSRVSRLRPEHRSRLDNVVSCPTLFQEHIPGRDVRVHVIGSDVYASEIVSGCDDYRYPGEEGPPEIRALTLPHDVEDRCRAMSRGMALEIAGIDLRRRDDGSWYCFEVNPSPAFTYYEAHTGQPMAAAIARLLSA